jgi:anti-sigma-K factor RskA
MSEPQDLRDLAPAYALGALDPDEARAFEAALSRSEELRREVASYREAAALLAFQEYQTPPADLRARVLARVRAESPRHDIPVVPIAEVRRPPRSGPDRALRVGLAAALLLAAWLGLERGTLTRRLATLDSTLAATRTRLAAREETLNAILEPGVQLIVLTASGEQPPGIQLFWDRQQNTAILHAFRLRPAPAGRAYQLWLIRGGRPIPSRVFNSEADGHLLLRGISIPAEPGIEAYAVTEEPVGGSPQPTGPILLLGRVPGT